MRVKMLGFVLSIFHSSICPVCNLMKHFPQTYSFFPLLVDAIMAIKLEYGIKKNWMGDPCFPTELGWEGVKCINASDSTKRIISL
jgi:hypothetical protein